MPLTNEQYCRLWPWGLPAVCKFSGAVTTKLAKIHQETASPVRPRSSAWEARLIKGLTTHSNVHHQRRPSILTVMYTFLFIAFMGVSLEEIWPYSWLCKCGFCLDYLCEIMSGTLRSVVVYDGFVVDHVTKMPYSSWVFRPTILHV